MMKYRTIFLIFSLILNNKLLVTIKLEFPDRANGYLTSHENAEYHKTSVVRATEFLSAMEKHDI